MAIHKHTPKQRTAIRRKTTARGGFRGQIGPTQGPGKGKPFKPIPGREPIRRKAAPKRKTASRGGAQTSIPFGPGLRDRIAKLKGGPQSVGTNSGITPLPGRGRRPTAKRTSTRKKR